VNRLLADGLGLVNSILAIIIIIVGCMIGYNSYGAAGLILGFLSSFIVSIGICGILAVAIDIKDTLHSIDSKMKAGKEPDAPTHQTFEELHAQRVIDRAKQASVAPGQ